MSLKSSIKLYIESQYPRWVSGWEIERLAMEGKFGTRKYKGANADRRARELAHPAWVLERYPEKKISCSGCDKGVIEHRTAAFVEYRGIRRGEVPKELELTLKSQGVLA